jgi:hypothetical protein
VVHDELPDVASIEPDLLGQAHDGLGITPGETFLYR